MLTVLAQHAHAVERGARCTECPLYGCGRGPVPSTLVDGATLLVAGEAPGKDEVPAGENFVGWSGGVLDEALILGGVSRRACTVINACACQPEPPYSLEEYIARERRKADREGRAFLSPLEACRPRFERDVDEFGARVYLAVGAAALDAFETWARARDLYDGDELVLARVHGAPIPLGLGHYLFASYHPAFAAREPQWHEDVRRDIKRAAAVAVRGWIDWSEPDYLIDPPVDVAIAWLEHARTTGAEVTVDLETCDPETGKPSADHYSCVLRCIGTAVEVGGVESVLVMHMRHMDGTLWHYEGDDLARLLAAYRETFDACPLAGHNIDAFDAEILLRLELVSSRSRLFADTLILHHDTPAQDKPHNLSYVGRSLFEVPAWKSKEDVQSTDNADDDKLALRCARDVLVTQRALPVLRARVEQAGTVAQYETDEACSTILRNAGDLGLFVDERERGMLSALLGRECDRLRRRWIDAVGRDVNPRSVPQLRDLFYGDPRFGGWGYDPPLNTEGKEFDDARDDPEDGSTGAAAILALIDRAAPAHADALECLLEYKALDKPRGTYVDNVPVRPFPGASSVPVLPAEGALPARPAISWIRPTWSMGRIPSGRANCKKPGVQQQPKRGRRIEIDLAEVDYYRSFASVRVDVVGEYAFVVPNMRGIIVAGPDHVLVGADQKALEARLYAAAAGDEIFYWAIANGVDIHAFNAATLLAERFDQVWSHYERLLAMPEDEREYWRYVAKKYVFGVIYGALPPKLFAVMSAERVRETGKRAFPGLKLEDCMVWFDRWHGAHPWTKQWQHHELALYAQRGYAASPILDERRRYGPLELNEIPNMAIQASGAAIKNRAMRLIDEAIPYHGWSWCSGLIIDGHDYLCVRVPKSEAERAARIVKDANAYEWREMLFEGSPKISENWGKQ